jgi:hypothetical protein
MGVLGQAVIGSPADRSGFCRRVRNDRLRHATAALGGAVPKQANVIVTGNPGQTFDIGPAGPEWRFVMSRAPEAEWCRAAYDFAGEALP